MRLSFKSDTDFNGKRLWYLSTLSEGEFGMADASVRLRLMGAALRRHRERLGLSIRDVASAMECDPSKISRQEAGHRGVWRHELRELLDEYGINDEERETRLRVADRRASQGWWDHYADVAPARLVKTRPMRFQARPVPVVRGGGQVAGSAGSEGAVGQMT